MESKIILRKRHIGGYKYRNCPDCKTEIETEHPIRIEMPYCGSCGKSVEDISHKYCGWCGSEFED
jgi:Zn ribbon nucleic-acid-binding protein